VATCLTVVGFLLPGPARAQAVRGTVTDEATGEAVDGAFVILVDDAGTRRASTLTDARGYYVLRASAPGRYRVRAERIGYETAGSELLELAPGTTRVVDLEIPATAVALEGISVRAERRCHVRPRDGGDLERLWGEVRKALAVAEWTEDAGILRYRTLVYSRTLDPERMTVRGEETRRRSGWGEHPFVSRAPEDLARGGFVQKDQDGRNVYLAPDARALLSDEFLRSHCFRIVEGDDEEPWLVGLGFEPVEGREVPDIRGTLWVDRQSAELRRLDFEYTGLAGARNAEEVGGRVEFSRLPTGAWIVSRWRIRMPILGGDRAWWRDAGSKSMEILAGIREVGGEVLEMDTPAGGGGVAADRAGVEGIVWDSTRSAPVAGARVYLSGTSHGTRTDSSGWFRLDDLAEGRYAVAFHHPRLDTLGLFVPAREVELERGRLTEIRLAVPSRETAARAVCRSRREGEEEPATAGAVVAGTVIDALTGAPVPGATVTVRREATSGAPPAEAEGGGAYGDETDQGGRFHLCGLPPGDLRVTATFLGRSGPPRRLTLARGDARIVELGLPLTDPTRVVVRVVEHGSGAPVDGASVLLGTDRGPVLTGADGRAVLAEVAPGIHALRVEALGYGTASDSILVRPAESVQVTVPVATEAIALPGIEVVVEERASRGIGMLGPTGARGSRADVLTLPQIEEVLPRSFDTADLLRNVRAPGLRVGEKRTDSGERALCVELGRSRTGLHGRCEMVSVYVDDVRLPEPEVNLLGALTPDQIQRIELLSPLEAGAIYGTGSRTGVLLIYTRDGGPRR